MKLSFHLLIVLAALVCTVPATGRVLKIETLDGPPWGFVGADGKITGMMYEIGNRIAVEAGYSYTNTLVPYPRTANDIERGTADIVLRFSNEQMLRCAVQVAKIAEMSIIVIGPAGQNYRSLNDLHGKTVGVVNTSSYEKHFDADPAIRKYAVQDYAQMVKMIARKRLDAGVGTAEGIYYSANLEGLKPEQFGIPLILGTNDFILHLSKKSANPEMIKRLQDAVKKLADNGEISKIIERYMGVDRQKPE